MSSHIQYFIGNFGESSQDKLVRILYDKAALKNVSLSPYSGTLIAALRFGHVPAEMYDDLDFVSQCKLDELECIEKVKELSSELTKSHPQLFQSFLIEMNGTRLTIPLLSKDICYPWIHIHILHPEKPTLQGYSHITPGALQEQENCFLSGRAWKCSKSAVLLLLNIGHDERYGETCPLFPDYHSSHQPLDIIHSTMELDKKGYASFSNLLSNGGNEKIQKLSYLYHPERFRPPLSTTLEICTKLIKDIGLLASPTQHLSTEVSRQKKVISHISAFLIL